MSPSPRPHSWISTSAIRTPRGSAAPMKTPTAYCASTLLKAPTYRCFPLTTSTMSRPSSTTDPAKPWAGKHPPKPSMNYSPTRSNHPLLHRPLETARRFRPTSRRSALKDPHRPFRERVGVERRDVIQLAFVGHQRQQLHDYPGQPPALRIDRRNGDREPGARPKDRDDGVVRILIELR